MTVLVVIPPHNNLGLQLNQFRCERRHSLHVTFGKSVFNTYVLSFDQPVLSQSLTECISPRESGCVIDGSAPSMCVLELLPFLCFCQPVFRFGKFHCFFGKRSPLTAHDFQRRKFIS